MEASVIRLSQATGKQLQEAARAARLQDVPNEVYGLHSAIFATDPSPMQAVILRKGLAAAGWNYLKVTPVVTPATEVDCVSPLLRKAVLNMANVAGDTVSIERVAAGVLYRVIPTESARAACDLARYIIAGGGFKPVVFEEKGMRAWTKTVKIEGRKYTAVVEARESKLRLSAFKGS